MKQVFVWVAWFLWVPSIFAADLRPLARPTHKAVRLVEGTWSCNAGYGAEQDQFNVKGQRVGPANRLDPRQGASRSGSLGLGCIGPGFYVNYRFLDRSLGLPRGTQVEGQVYDHLSLRLDQFALGTSVALIPHRLALDLGVQRYILSYTLGLYPRTRSKVVRSEVMKNSGTLLHSRLRLYVNAFFFISYEFSENLDPNGVLQSSAQLGMNMTVRY